MKIKFYFQLVLTLIAGSLAAQSTVIDDNKDVVLILNGTAKVSYEKPDKISEEPKFVDSVKVKIDVNYTSVDKKVESRFPVQTIKPPKLLLLEPLGKLYKGVLDIGLNDFKSPPYLNFNYGTTRSRDYSAGIKARHFSSDLNIANTGETRFTENSLELFGKKFYKKRTMYGAAEYDYNTLRNYGYDINSFQVQKDDLKQYYSTLKLTAGVTNKPKDAEVNNYNAEINYEQLTAKYNVKEYLIGGEFHTYWYDPFAGKLPDTLFRHDSLFHLLELDASVKHLVSSDTSQYVESTLINVGTKYKLRGKLFNLSLGLVDVTILSNNARGLYYTQKVNFDYAFAKDILIGYVDYSRKYTRNYYIEYMDQNLFIGSNVPHTNSFVKANVTLGVKGAMSSKTTFNVGVQYKKVDGFVLFVNDVNTIDSRKFTVITDNVVQKRLFGELMFENKKIKSGLLAEYNAYDVFNNEAYHLPSFKAQGYAKYNVQDKFEVGTDIMYYGKQLAMDTNPLSTGAITLNPILDFNISINYHYSDKIGGFLKVNNVLSTKHQRWNQYQNFGINVLGGVSFKF